MGAEFDTDWIVGHPITFEGNWKGTAYRDHGAVVSFDPERLVQFTQFSSMSGKADEAENYDLVTFELSGADNGTLATRRLGTAMTGAGATSSRPRSRAVSLDLQWKLGRP